MKRKHDDRGRNPNPSAQSPTSPQGPRTIPSNTGGPEPKGYGPGPRNATGWPISGRPAQDSIVLNPLHIEHPQPTDPDRSAFLFLLEQIQNENSSMRGAPNLKQGNPNSPDGQARGGVYIRGHGRGYGVRRGKVYVQKVQTPQERSPVTPTPVTKPQEATPPASPPSGSPLLFFVLAIAGAVGYYFYRKGKGKQPSLEAVR